MFWSIPAIIAYGSLLLGLAIVEALPAPATNLEQDRAPGLLRSAWKCVRSGYYAP